MINTDQWPMWLKYSILIPHLVLLVLLTYLWWPRSNKSLVWTASLWIYLVTVYFLILRSMAI